MPLPTYDAFLRESLDVADAYFQVHHTKMSPPDAYHNAYRRLVEGWSHANIVHDILGEPLDPDPEPEPEPPPPEPEPPPGEPPPPGPAPVARPIIGRLRLGGGRFYDQHRSRVILHKHAFTMFWEWLQNRDRCRQEFFTPITQAGYPGVRVLTTVNKRGAVPWWEPFGIRLSPFDQPAFYQEFREFCVELSVWGLQAHFVSGGSEGWSDAEYEDFHLEIGTILGQVERAVGRDVCDLYEVQNEVLAPTGTNVSPSRLDRLAQIVMGARGNDDGLYGLSGLGGMEDRAQTTAYTMNWQAAMLVHPMREPVSSPRLTDVLGHYLTWMYEDPVREFCVCGEPGAYTTGRPGGVSGMEDPLNAELGTEEGASLYATLQCLCKSVGTLMSDPGVTGPRHQYPFAEVPGFWTAPKLVQLLEDFAPDLHTWKIGHWRRDYMRVKLVENDDRVRIDGLTEQGGANRSAVVVHGQPGTWTLDIGRPDRVRVIHAKNDRTIRVEEWQGERYIPVTFDLGRLVLVG